MAKESTLDLTEAPPPKPDQYPGTLKSELDFRLSIAHV